MDIKVDSIELENQETKLPNKTYFSCNKNPENSTVWIL